MLITSTLARCLPHGAARRLGAALGRLSVGTRRRAAANLQAAFPDFEETRVVRLAREACAHRMASRLDGASACRFDARALCRRIKLEHWSYLEAAESQGQGLLVLGAGFGSWQIAALAVALYRGPIETLGPWRGDPVFGPLAASFERRGGSRLFGELAGGEQLEWSLRTGDRVGFLADRAASHGETVSLPFLGRNLETKTLVARASIDTGAPVVPVFGRPRGGGWSIEVQEPIQPAITDASALTQRYLAVLEEAIRRQPEMWLGWWSRSF